MAPKLKDEGAFGAPKAKPALGPAEPNEVPPVFAAELNRLPAALLPSASIVSSEAGVAFEDEAPNINGVVCWFEDGCEAPNAGKVDSGLAAPPKVNEDCMPPVVPEGFAGANEKPWAVDPLLKENGLAAPELELTGVDVIPNVCAAG